MKKGRIQRDLDEFHIVIVSYRQEGAQRTVLRGIWHRDVRGTGRALRKKTKTNV